MKFLVTGGRGFIGSHFVNFCLSKGHEVIDIDVMTYVSNKILPWDNNPNYAHINEDIGSLSHLPLCDIIVNFAAESHVDNSINEPDVFTRTNILGTQNLLNLLRGKVYERPLFVHISTDEVYGDIFEGDVTETSTLNPSNPYSASKASAEMLVFSYGKTYGIDYQICRSSNNYGPRQYPEKLIPKIIERLKQDNHIPIHGNGSYIRDWTYVGDNVYGIYKVCFAENKNEIWNISANNCLTNIEVVDIISNWMGKKPKIKFVENRLGQDMRYSISSEKIRNELNWIPEKKDLFNFLA